MASSSLVVRRIDWVLEQVRLGYATTVSVTYNAAARTQKIKFNVYNSCVNGDAQTCALEILQTIRSMTRTCIVVDKGHASHSQSCSVVEFWVKEHSSPSQVPSTLPPPPAPPLLPPTLLPGIGDDNNTTAAINHNLETLGNRLRDLEECYVRPLYDQQQVCYDMLSRIAGPHNMSYSMQALIDAQNDTTEQYKEWVNSDTRGVDKLDSINSCVRCNTDDLASLAQSFHDISSLDKGLAEFGQHCQTTMDAIKQQNLQQSLQIQQYVSSHAAKIDDLCAVGVQQFAQNQLLLHRIAQKTDILLTKYSEIMDVASKLEAGIVNQFDKLATYDAKLDVLLTHERFVHAIKTLHQSLGKKFGLVMDAIVSSSSEDDDAPPVRNECVADLVVANDLKFEIDELRAELRVGFDRIDGLVAESRDSAKQLLDIYLQDGDEDTEVETLTPIARRHVCIQMRPITNNVAVQTVHMASASPSPFLR